jgi:hypothetical protein
MSIALSNNVKLHITTFNVESQIYQRMFYDVKGKLNAIVTTGDDCEFVSIRYLPNLNLPSLKECIENKTGICFMLISEGVLDMFGVPISIDNNILAVQQGNKRNEYDLDSILLRSELKSDYEEFLDSLQLNN